MKALHFTLISLAIENEKRLFKSLNEISIHNEKAFFNETEIKLTKGVYSKYDKRLKRILMLSGALDYMIESKKAPKYLEF